MKAGLRLRIAALAAGLTVGHGAGFAQSTAQPPADSPPKETIGPRELQNFSLDGKATPSADAPAATAGAPVESAPPRRAVTRAAESARTEAPASAPRPTASQRVAEVRERPAPRPTTANPAQSLTLALPPATAGAGPLPTALPKPGFSADAAPASAPLAPESGGMVLWPWLLLAAVLGVAGAVLLRRRRAREEFAGGPEIDAFVAPEPQREPRPAPSPPAASRPKPVGVVSAKLRPWIDLEFTPLQCIVDQDRMAFDFEVNLFNSGGAPARDVLIEARIFTAGPDQEQQLNAFFAQPAGPGERTPALPPLQRLTIRTSLFAEREHLRPVELGGRSSIVPLIAFNATYRAAGSTGRTSGCFMLGRKTKADKLAPFRADAGARAYADVGAVALPQSARL